MTKQEIADRLLELRRNSDNFIQAGDWDALILFLAEVFEVPDSLIYTEVPGEMPMGWRPPNLGQEHEWEWHNTLPDKQREAYRQWRATAV